MNIKIIRSAVLIALGGLLLGGCVEGNAKYTGGGELPSSGGAGKAYIQVDADTCAGNENAKGKFTYADRTAVDWSQRGGVSFTGTIAKAGLCVVNESAELTGNETIDSAECQCPGWPAIIGTYTSSNPALPGGGRYFACFYSQRDGAIDGNTTPTRATLVQRVVMVDGPYANYENHGTLRGNILSTACGT